VVADLPKLREYPWSGHSVLLGKMGRDWQDTESILSFFGPKLQKARVEYERFVADGVPMGRRPDLVGGGLIRSAGGWSQVLSLRRHKLRMASDERILGSGEFIEEVLCQTEKRLEETLRLKARKVELGTLASRVSRSEGTDWDLVRSGSRVDKFRTPDIPLGYYVT
jgi:hypothetical protein